MLQTDKPRSSHRGTLIIDAFKTGEHGLVTVYYSYQKMNGWVFYLLRNGELSLDACRSVNSKDVHGLITNPKSAYFSTKGELMEHCRKHNFLTSE
jgi:hypothetical protein